MSYEEDFDEEFDIDEEVAEDGKPVNGIIVKVSVEAMRDVGRAVTVQVGERVERIVLKAVEKKLADIVDEAVRKVIGDKVEPLVLTELEKPRQKFNEWGTPTGPKVTFAEQIPGCVESWMNAKVDDKGNPSNYSGDNTRTRAGWIIGAHVKKDIDTAIQSAVSGITQQARAIVTQKVAAFMSEQLVPTIEIKPKS